MRRILVGAAPIRPAQVAPTPAGHAPRLSAGHQPPPRPVAIPAHVGVLFWRGGGVPLVTVLVKATASFRSGALTFVEARPLSATSDAPGKPNDFVPAKRLCDVLLSGHVHVPPGPKGVTPLHAIVRAPGASLAFVVTSGAPGRAPLVPPYVAVAGEGVNEVGPRAIQGDPAHDDFTFPEDFDYETFQAAHPRLRSESVPAGSEIVIEGLSEDGTHIVVGIPAVAPRALIEWTRDPEPSDTMLELDTVHIDLDARVVDLVWRGNAESRRDQRHQIDRVLVGFASDEDFHAVETDDPEVRFAGVLRELPRGKWSYAWERDDVIEGKEPPPLPEEELEMARYESLGAASGPESTLTLAEHAAIAAELLELPMGRGTQTPSLEEREARAAVLRRQGFDDFGWSVEERAHAERMASMPEDSEGGSHAEYGRLFVEAQDRLKPPDEALPNARDYATISVRLQVEQPRDVLSDAKLSLGAWMRVDRAWQNRMDDDPQARRDVEFWLEHEGAERGEPRVPEVDEEGRVVS